LKSSEIYTHLGIPIAKPSFLSLSTYSIQSSFLIFSLESTLGILESFAKTFSFAMDVAAQCRLGGFLNSSPKRLDVLKNRGTGTGGKIGKMVVLIIVYVYIYSIYTYM